MKTFKYLLVAVNSKYIHSNLAVFCLRSAAGEYMDNVVINEYTINNQIDDILQGIYLEKPDAIGFSCYIWNISYVKTLIRELGKILPSVPIWLGGPEVSYNADYYVKEYGNVAGVMKGEGEFIFKELITCYVQDRIPDIDVIPGITTATRDNSCPAPIDMSKMELKYPFKDYKNKIIYYESSRGCPFSCSYCLSSVDKNLRFRDTELVLKDLQNFIDNEVAQVKFVDRTFNCKREHALTIWRYINEHDNGITNFHFEIAADILNMEEIELINSMRPGLIQLEIGVQSTNPETICAIHRHMDLDILRANVAAIHKFHNIHMHLDLIAGLPYEGMESFEKSFNDIYEMEPDQLQLGFLKLLYGSRMREEANEYGIVGRDEPPYEVLYTKWLSYEEMCELKLVENVVDMFYNSAMFKTSLKFLKAHFTSAFRMYYKFGKFYIKRFGAGSLPSKNSKYELIFDFGIEYVDDCEKEFFTELIKYDMLKRDNAKSLPYFMKSKQPYIEDHKQTKASHYELFDYDVEEYEINGSILKRSNYIFFNYLEKNKLTGDAIFNRNLID